MLTRSLFLLSLAVSAIFAAVPNQAHLNFNVQTKYAVASESIDVNYRDNYVIFSTQQQAQSVVMLHDYTQGVSMVKQKDYCFVLDEFDNLPENIEDWAKIKEQLGDVEDVVDGDVMTKESFYYRVLPFIVDRSTLPASIRGFCSGPIRVLVLKEFREGDDTVGGGTAQPSGGVAELFIPGSVLKSRVKRQSSTRVTVGENNRGPFVSGSASRNNGRGTSGSLSGGYNFGDRSWNAGGSVSHTRGSWTTSGRGNYDSLGGGNVGGSVNYNRGSFSAGIGANHNLRTHDTGVRATLRWDF